jgi:predicted porin
MQKKLIALAIAGLISGGALAQTNVTVYGTIGLAIDSGNYGRGNVTRLTSGAAKTERLGFQGSEDLGGGLKANFRLEMGPNTDNGANDSAVGQFFQREARLGLSGSFGSLDAGRQYSPLFSLQAANDQFFVAGVGSNYALTSNGFTRVSNSLKWTTSNMGGFTATILYGLGDTGAPAAAGAAANGRTLQESTTDPKDIGRHTGLNLRYANGPLHLGYAYAAGKTTVNLLATPIPTPTTNTVNYLGGQYDFGPAKVVGSWESFKNSATSAGDYGVWSLGVGIDVMGKDEFKIVYTSKKLKNVINTDSNLFALGYDHPMSKRTKLFATWSKMTNDSRARESMQGAPSIVAADAGYDPSALQVGVSHEF